MGKSRYFLFEPFRLDALDERLWEREKSIRLGHKALAVLQHLLSRSGGLVTKDDLLATAWLDTAVCEYEMQSLASSMLIQSIGGTLSG